jgi:cytochrome c biogenesis protein CcmG/thiol:disulfide interchange protein DsbE
MTQKTRSAQQQPASEQSLARTQRQELKDELTEHFVQRVRLPGKRRRVVTFSLLGTLALLALLFLVLVLLPASPQQLRTGIAVGKVAPLFRLPVQGGVNAGKSILDLRSLRGRPVVINFWSESCQPCLSEVPYLREIYARPDASRAFSLLGINIGDPREDIAMFGITYYVNYPLLFDTASQVDRAYGITSLPITYFIDSNGVVRFVVPQELTPQSMQQGLDAIGVTLP